MSEVLTTIVEKLSQRDTSAFDGTAKFEIQDEGAIILDRDGIRIGDDEADVTLSASLETFRGIFEGNINPTTAFMTGKLKVSGSMGKAMALASALA